MQSMEYDVKMKMHYPSVRSRLNKRIVFANNLVLCHSMSSWYRLNIFLVKIVSSYPFERLGKLNEP